MLHLSTSSSETLMRQRHPQSTHRHLLLVSAVFQISFILSSAEPCGLHSLCFCTSLPQSNTSEDQPYRFLVPRAVCHNVNMTIISTFFHPKLQSLDLSFNSIPVVADGLRLYPSLVYLNLSHNRIAEVEEKDLVSAEKLRVVDLSRNLIGVLHPQSFIQLKELEFLDLRGNQIRELSENLFQALDAIRMVNLADNLLRDLRFLTPQIVAANSGNSSLASLILSNNKLDDSSFTDLPSSPNPVLTIHSLNLGKNPKIRKLSLVLASFPGVTVMDLSHCGIGVLDLNWLNLAPNLRNLNLSHNQISVIKYADMKINLDVLKRFNLDLADNGIVCDCDLLKLRNSIGNGFVQVFRGLECFDRNNLPFLENQCSPPGPLFLPLLIAGVVGIILVASLIALALYFRHNSITLRLPSIKWLTRSRKPPKNDTNHQEHVAFCADTLSSRTITPELKIDFDDDKSVGENLLDEGSLGGPGFYDERGKDPDPLYASIEEVGNLYVNYDHIIARKNQPVTEL